VRLRLLLALAIFFRTSSKIWYITNNLAGPTFFSFIHKGPRDTLCILPCDFDWAHKRPSTIPPPDPLPINIPPSPRETLVGIQNSISCAAAMVSPTPQSYLPLPLHAHLESNRLHSLFSLRRPSSAATAAATSMAAVTSSTSAALTALSAAPRLAEASTVALPFLLIYACDEIFWFVRGFHFPFWCPSQDKAIKRFQVRNIVEQAAIRDVQEACVHDGKSLTRSASSVNLLCDLLFWRG
jgi:hypothetical protein